MNRGFTFIELIAVIGVLIILAAIVLPTLTEADERARFQKCAENMRRVNQGIMSYLHAKGHYPPGRMFLNATTTPGIATDMIKWYNAIAPHVGAGARGEYAMGMRPGAQGFLWTRGAGEQDDVFPDYFRCPDVPKWDKVGWNMSIGYNFHFLGNSDPWGVTTSDQPSKPGTDTGLLNYPVNISQIPRPDMTITIADSEGTGMAPYQSASDDLPDFTRIGAFGYLLDPTWLRAQSPNENELISSNPIRAGWPDANIGAAAGGLVVTNLGEIRNTRQLGLGIPTEQKFRSRISNRHKGGANVAFADGHIEHFQREELYLDRARFSPADNPKNINLVYFSNRYWNGFGYDNDLDGNGVIDTNKGEEIRDSNECFVFAGGATPRPRICRNYNPSQITNCNLIVPIDVTGLKILVPGTGGSGMGGALPKSSLGGGGAGGRGGSSPPKPPPPPKSPPTVPPPSAANLPYPGAAAGLVGNYIGIFAGKRDWWDIYHSSLNGPLEGPTVWRGDFKDFLAAQ